jgi:hypothetical protein
LENDFFVFLFLESFLLVETKWELQDSEVRVVVGGEREKPVKRKGEGMDVDDEEEVSRDRVKLGQLVEFGAWWREITEGGENLLRGGEKEEVEKRVEERRRGRREDKGKVKRGRREERENMERMKMVEREEGRKTGKWADQPKWCEIERVGELGGGRRGRCGKRRKGGGIQNTPGIMDRELI